jgi:hypothetical protein
MAGKKQDAKEKPLEKMTAKELRELAKGLEGIAGVHGMNKPELVAAIQKAKGIEPAPGKGSDSSVRDLKKHIRLLKGQRRSALNNDDTSKAVILRRRIARLKKKTRRAA